MIFDSSSFCLVPKLRLGTPVRETLFRERPQHGKRSFPEGRSQTEFGNEGNVERRMATRHSRERRINSDLGRRQRHPSRSAHARPGQARRSLWRTYRIIDFTLSNCINSDLRRILVLTQYKASSLDRHIAAGWGFLCRELDEYIDPLPPQQRIDEHWYQGTADAIYQNIYTIEKADPRYVVILAGDHIYKMDYADMIEAHLDNSADLTIGCITVPLRDASSSASWKLIARTACAVFRKSHGIPLPCRVIRTIAWHRWAFTFSPPGRCTSCSARTPRMRTATTTLAGTSSRR